MIRRLIEYLKTDGVVVVVVVAILALLLCCIECTRTAYPSELTDQCTLPYSSH